jgi:predicted alpha-1,2-mannosidase
VKSYIAALLLAAAPFSRPQRVPPVDAVNPMIGTESRFELSHGNTNPTVALPFGMTAWTPQSDEGGWVYTQAATTLQGIRATHQPSVWMGDYGDFAVMPMADDLMLLAKDRAAPFRHESERSEAYGYEVTLDRGPVRIEVTPTMRGARMRFTYPIETRPLVVLDANKGGSWARVSPPERKIVGYSRRNNGGVPDGFACYFVVVFDQAFAEWGTWADGVPAASAPERKADRAGAYAGFPRGTQTVQVKIATSFIGLEQAERNLALELPGWDFLKTRAEARKAWERELGRVEIEGATQDQETVFYTALYRTLLFPRAIHEPDPAGRPHHMSPFDGRVHAGPMYTDTGFWDSFRAQFPLFTLLYPERDLEIVEGLLHAYDEGGWLPKWPSPGYRDCMIGTHADSVIADAYMKGLRGFDAEKALAAMLKDASVKPDFGGYGRAGIDEALRLGYVPADRVKEATARTLEFAYDDFCIAQVAQGLGRTEEHDRLLARSRNFRNVWDPQVGFMRGRLANGSWLSPFSPVAWGGPYTEGSAWHYTWSVMHDVHALVDLIGGRELFAAKLDAMLQAPPHFEVGTYKREIHEMTEMVAAKMGQYAHGNEPVHHVLYLYSYAGQPWKTQKWVRHVVDALYGPGPDGLCGDEDTGQMSAWYLFSTLGFYPVCPGVPEYVLGTPLFAKATLRFPDGKVLTIRTEGGGPGRPYVQSVRLNGQPWTNTWIAHEALVGGGRLDFVMGAEPNLAWGSNPEAAPFSASRPK